MVPKFGIVLTIGYSEFLAPDSTSDVSHALRASGLPQSVKRIVHNFVDTFGEVHHEVCPRGSYNCCQTFQN